jgi:hypothetical protein
MLVDLQGDVPICVAWCPNLHVLILHSTGVSNYVAANMPIRAGNGRLSSALTLGFCSVA